jgi:hypothetical protein
VEESSRRYGYTFFIDSFKDTCKLGWVPEGIILIVVSVSALTRFIRYICYWNLQFLNNVIIIKTKDKPCQCRNTDYYEDDTLGDSTQFTCIFERVNEKYVNPKSCYRAFVPTNFVKNKSEWVSDCSLTPTQQFFSYGENKLIFNEMMMRSALC